MLPFDHIFVTGGDWYGGGARLAATNSYCLGERGQEQPCVGTWTRWLESTPVRAWSAALRRAFECTGYGRGVSCDCPCAGSRFLRNGYLRRLGLGRSARGSHCQCAFLSAALARRPEQGSDRTESAWLFRTRGLACGCISLRGQRGSCLETAISPSSISNERMINAPRQRFADWWSQVLR